MGKRLIAMLMAMVMTLSLVQVTAFAEGAGSSSSGGTEIQITAIQDSLSIGVGAYTTYNLTMKDDQNLPLENQQITWSNTTPSVASITVMGAGTTVSNSIGIQGLQSGETVITGYYQGQLAVTLTVKVLPSIHLSVGADLELTDLQDGEYPEINDSTVVAIGQTPDETNPALIHYSLHGVMKGMTYLSIYKDVQQTDGSTVRTLIRNQRISVGCYVITWQTDDSTVQTSMVEEGETPSWASLSSQPPAKPEDAEFTYAFASWAPAPAPVYSDMLYVAQYDKTAKYSISFTQSTFGVDAGGSLDLGANVSILPSPGTYGDTASWQSSDETVATVDNSGKVTTLAAGTATITCKVANSTGSCTLNVTNPEGYHTITWNIATKTYKTLVADGQTPEAPASTARATDETASYTFKNWEPALKAADGDATYTANYDLTYIEYTVTFKDWDNTTTLQETTYHYGDTPQYTAAAPSRPLDIENNIYYHFTGWDRPFEEVTKSTTYYAKYEQLVLSDQHYYIELSENERQMYLGETVQLTATAVPKDLQRGDIQWSIVNNTAGVIELSSSGQVTAIGAGEATVCATDGNMSSYCTITVTARSYTVTWVVGNTTNEQKFEENTMPVYNNGNTPTKPATASEYYVFNGWTPILAPVTKDVTYVAGFDAHPIISLQMNQPSLTLRKGESAALEVSVTPADQQESVALEWSSSNTNYVTVDEEGNIQGIANGTATITAKEKNSGASCSCLVTVQAPKYTITWIVDGVKSANTCYEGSMPQPVDPAPTKAQDAQYTYEFTGWTPEVIAATSDASYQAVFSKAERVYTITWTYGNASKTEQHKYGDDITNAYPTDAEVQASLDAMETAKERYEFAGWSPSNIVKVTATQTFVAQVSTINKHYVDITTAPQTLFLGDHLQMDMTKNLSNGIGYRWTSSKPDVAAIDDSGYVTAKAAGTTTITLTSTDGLCSDSCELTIAEHHFTITWKMMDGTENKEDYVEGETPSFKGSTDAAPTNTQTFSFKGWSPAITAVTGNQTYIATYTASTRHYTITWNNDGAITTEQYVYGETPSFKGTTNKENTNDVAYVFTGWSPALAPVASDQTYVAQYGSSARQYSITWNVDGNITSELYDYGATPSYKGSTAKTPSNEYTYSFAGWNTPLLPVTGTALYVAKFTQSQREYTITWNIDGKTKTGAYTYGATPSFSGVTDKAATDAATYAFKGWTPDIVPVAGDATYTAVYTETAKLYAVTFKNWDGTVLLTNSKVAYNTDASTLAATVTATKPSTTSATDSTKSTTYKFKEWSPTLGKITKDTTYTATFTSSDGSSTTPTTGEKVTVTFKNWDKTVLETKEITKGTKPTYTGETPTRETTTSQRYTFSGWSPELSEITSNTTYTAQFSTENSSTLTIPEADLSKAVTGTTTNRYELSNGVMYMTKEALTELAKYKQSITITTTKSNDAVYVKLTRGSSSGTVITKEIPGLTFCATTLSGSGDILEISKGTSKSNYETQMFSVVNDDGAYCTIPGTCYVKVDESSRNFGDVYSSNWAADGIDFATSHGIMIGTTATTFSPKTNASRAQTITMLYRMASEPVSVGGIAFKDMKATGYYAKAVMWGTSKTTGPIAPLDSEGYKGDGKFGIYSPCERQDMVLWIYNLTKYFGYECKETLGTSGTSKYYDWALITKTGDYEAAMKWAVETGIVEGTTKNGVNPHGSTTREQMATLLQRMVEYMVIPEDAND